jgi:hypothetical protein
MEVQVWIDSVTRGELLQEFTLTVDENQTVEKGVEKFYDLKYSYLAAWTHPGKSCASLTDDGNGVTIELGKKKIKLDYAEAEQVLVLLGYNNDEHIEYRKSELIKKI